MDNKTDNTLPPTNNDSFVTKKMAVLSIIIGVIAFLGILGIIYKTFGLKVLSNTLFLISIYILMLSLVFFTIGLFVEKKVIKKNIDFIVDKVVSDLNPKKPLKLTKKQEKELDEVNTTIKKKIKMLLLKRLYHLVYL